MSKFGAHVSLGRRDGIGAALKSCYDAGSPVPGIIALDQNLYDDIITYSPSTMLVFRTQLGGNPNPPNIWQVDPLTIANAWYDYRLPTWRANRADVYVACNEMDAATPGQFDWQNAFDLRLMERATADGLTLGVGYHSAGTPSDDGGTTRYDKWARLVPSMQYAKAHGHKLILHEYGMTTTLPNSAPSLALRYRSVLDYLAQFDADPQVIIGECSDYNGYSGEGAAWLNGVEWYDSQVINDQRVDFFGAYQLGGDENWYSLIPQWSEYVASHPTPINPPPVEPREFDHWLDLDTGATFTANPYSFAMPARNVRLESISRPKPPTQYTCQLSSDDPSIAVTGGGTFKAGDTVTAFASEA